MKYRSTRDASNKDYTFEDAILSGYAPDGGMFLPAHIPQIQKEQLKTWSTLSYVDLVKEIIPLFISSQEISRADLGAIIDRSYNRFRHPEVLHTTCHKDGLNVLEMYHGPTMAFKDLALACVGQLMDYFLTKRNTYSNVLVVTSGDTGSAVIESVRGLKSLDVLVGMPGNKRCSRVQELQMTTVCEDNVHVFRVDGTSDEMDEAMKNCFLDEDLVKKHHISTLNSINWARIMVQIVAYFYSYFQLCPGCDGEVEVVVPTGGAGNVTGGVIARAMGLPVKLVSVVNCNDTMVRILSRGDYSLAKEVKRTMAPSMDIQVPGNMERVLLICGLSPEQIRTHMTEFENTGKTDLPTSIVDSFSIESFSVSEDDIKAAMRRCWEENRFIPCPHTAIAVSYHYLTLDKNGPPSIPRMCMATASAEKFEEAVRLAGLTPEISDYVQRLESLPTACVDVARYQELEKYWRKRLDEIHSRRKPGTDS